MDPVDSVTKNSNNNETKMENKPRYSNDMSGAAQQQQQQPQLFDDGTKEAGDGDVPSFDMSPSGVADETSAIVAPTHQLQPPPTVENNIPKSNDNSQATKSPAQMSDYLKAIGMDPKKFWPKKYRFTREKSPGQHNPLTILQRNFYEANGYIILDECAPKRLLDSIRTQHKQSAMINEFLVDKLAAKNAKMLQYAKCFCDERLMLMTHQLIESFQTNEMAKQVMDNKQVPRQQLFRDWVYLPFRPIDRVCCALTAIEPLEHVVLVVPGTHRVGQCTISSTLENISAAYDTSQEKTAQLRELFEISPENLSDLVDKSRKGFKYVNLKAGQTLFYHPGLIHGFSSDLINFRKTQLALFAYYAAADCEYIDLRQKTSATEPAAAAPAELPISLAHFGDKNPSDYTSWIDKPILLRDSKAANL